MRRFTSPASYCVLAGLALCCGGCGLISYGENASGVELYQQGDYDAAIRRFQHAITTEPGYADGYYNLAATYHQLWKLRGRTDQGLATQAESLYTQCLQRDREHADGYRGLAVFLADQGRRDDAFRLVGDWTTRSAQPAEAKIVLAGLYADFGDHVEARKRLQEALEIDPKNPRALANLARLQEAAGERAQALTNYTRSLELDPSLPGVEQRIAALHGALGESPAAPASAGTRVVAAPQRLPRY